MYQIRKYPWEIGCVSRKGGTGGGGWMHLKFTNSMAVTGCIRERGSVLYLGMAKEISKYHTDAPAGKRPKKLLPPKPSMQTEWYCLAVHKNTRKRTWEYAGVE